MTWIKLSIVSIGLIAYMFIWLVPSHKILFRVSNMLLAAAGVVALLAWINFGAFHAYGKIHATDMFHYVIGAKYQPELGYGTLYECTTLALLENRLGGAPFIIRDLTGNDIIQRPPLKVLKARCAMGFGEVRWSYFKKDIALFRENIPEKYWSTILQDHGYNPSPVFSIIAKTIVERSELTRNFIYLLSCIDYLLLLLSGFIIYRSWGWRTASVTAIFWGGFVPIDFEWTGGSYLRMLWLFCLVLGVAQAKRGRLFTGGALMSLSSLLTVFPGIVFLTYGLRCVANCFLQSSWVPEKKDMKFFSGAAAMTILCFGLSCWSLGFSQWKGFKFNAIKHSATALTNNMGIKTATTTLTGFSGQKLHQKWALEPFKKWKLNQIEVWRNNRFSAYLFSAAILALLILASLRMESWEALCLGVGAILFYIDLTSYYCGFLILLILLSTKQTSIGALMLALALLSGVFWFAWPWADEYFAMVSYLTLATIVAGICISARSFLKNQVLSDEPREQALRNRVVESV